MAKRTVAPIISIGEKVVVRVFHPDYVEGVERVLHLDEFQEEYLIKYKGIWLPVWEDSWGWKGEYR
jgi:hypothetical protein